jgi:very-short-patch-repair endonuclease
VGQAKTGDEGGESGAFVALRPDVRTKGDKGAPDALIIRIATNQYGVVSRDQLRSAGLSSTGVSRRIAVGRLHRIHRGVYAVGHPRLSNEGRWMAAVLACGDGAVLSHRSAAALWGIRRPPKGPVDVTIPGTAGRKSRAGIALHRSTTLIASSCTRRLGIPVTTPARTLADLPGLLSPAQLAAAIREAEFLGLSTGDRAADDPTRSDLEHLFIALCRRHRLLKPKANATLDRYEVDFLWQEHRLVAEVDGWESHRTRSAFEEDRARDTRLAVLGYEVLRFTWRQIERDPSGVAKTIRARLRARS